MLHLMDIRYAGRLLRRSPFFTLLTVVVLSGGLGLAIFTFSFLHTAMLKPLPLANGASVVSIREESATSGGALDLADVAQMRGRIRSLTSLGAYYTQSVVIGDESHPHVIQATITESSLFEVAPVRPAFGRTLRRDDQADGAEPVIVLSYRTWKAKFGADTSMVDATIRLSGTITRVVGVMPEGFGFPVAADSWMPMSNALLATATPGRSTAFLYARLANNVSADEAQSELNHLYKRALAHDRTMVTDDQAMSDLANRESATIVVESFPMAQMGEQGPLALTVLNLLAVLILLLACINVTNLLLARANERARETAVRLALGASRARLIMQCLWESILLCVMGGVAATGAAAWGLSAINRWAQSNLEGNLAFWWVWQLDQSSLLAAGVFVTATIAVLGIVVSARATSVQLTAVLNDGSARSGGRREGRFARALVITQVATVSVLMFFGVMSGIVAYRIANVEVGYDTRNLLGASVSLTDVRYESPAARTRFFETTVSALLLGTTVSDALLRAPLASIADPQGAFAMNDRAPATPGGEPRAWLQGISGSINTLGIRVLEGRAFDSRDSELSAPVAIISQAIAEKYWPGTSAIGRQIQVSAFAPGEGWRTVVGVVNNVLMGNPFSRERSALAIHIPLSQTAARNVEFVFRHRGNLPAAQAALHRTLAQADASLLPPDIASFDEILNKTGLIARSTAKLFAGCFAFALLLAVSGTYGLMARSIGQRTREIGVRRALGASDQNVTALLLGQGGRQLGIGVVFALPIMLLVGIGFARFFPIAVAVSVTSAVLVASAIVGMVLVATWVPTRQAIRTPLREALWRD